ncbi:site-specific DNA-methyltransferase [uncultured Gemmiger sp.]|uniref:site-specific DNA-methyltransferase n=1 Tax=uncultured Gemmiger sp. TaxID=1623490 RepID=UPI0025ED2DB4|nr:site-specific DNA-methyltransferase [uncultured Gemmiger sp.]
MDKMRMESVDMTTQNIEKIGALFPNCITETKDESGRPKKAINFELLKQMLSEDLIDGDEAYEFTWVGKKSAIVEANKPIRKTLRPCKEESVNWDTTENLYIEGDNLEVLKLLQESYLGKVKMIYIDPPYNTGNDFIYRDNFALSSEEYVEDIGQYDDEGNRLFRNTDSNGRFHSDWCSMIYSRLMLARNLLTDDGVIFISVDDSELDNMIKICNEIFGNSNTIANFVIVSNSAKNNSKFVSVTHEYLLCIAKNKKLVPVEWRVKRSNSDTFIKLAKKLMESGMSDEEIHSELLALVKYPKYYEFDHYTYVDSRGPFRASDLTAPGSKNKYDIVHPKTKKICKTGARGWAYSEIEMKKLIDNDYIFFGADETVMPQLKNYLFENEMALPKSVLFFDSQASTKWMKAEKLGFDFPKAIDYIKYILSMYPEDNFTIVDFFSGSGTTAHAAMQLNAEDGGNRKFIMVQLPEPCDEKGEAFKAGYKNICEIGKERIRRAGKKIKEENPLTTQNLDIGFRVLKLADSNMNDVYYGVNEYNQDMLSMLESNIKPDRTDLDLLFGCLLEWGLPLSLPYSAETIEGCTVHNYNDGDLIACFDENVPDNVIKAIAKKQPLRAVFRDSSFANSPSKINVGEIFKMLAPDTRVKVI